MKNCFKALNRSFQQFNKSNADFGLPMPVETRGAIHQHPDSSKIDPDARTFYDANVNLLNEQQQRIFCILTRHIDNNEGGFYNIDAPGGTGKTFLSNLILAHARKDHKIAIGTVLSGIAATLLKMGTTFHKRFGIPVPCNETSSCSLHFNSPMAQVIQNAAIIFIDEISMATHRQLECVH